MAGILPPLGREHPVDPARTPPLGWRRTKGCCRDAAGASPCQPHTPHNSRLAVAASAKVDLVSINKGIIAREKKTWLQDGPCPITAVVGLQQPLPCNYPAARQHSTALPVLFLATEPRARSGGSLQRNSLAGRGDAGVEVGDGRTA